MRRFFLVLPATIFLLAASRAPAVVAPLLTTTWGQDGEFATFSPDNWRLGCWSTALAQILYYHRLAPHGSVTYDCTDYHYHISENLNSYSFNWSLFVDSINGSTPWPSVEQVAKYSYYTSVVVEKDFGTGSYVLSHASRIAALEDHYTCDTALYALGWNWDGTSLHYYDKEDLEAIIADELNAHRPLMMHMRDEDENYHAVAIDGYNDSGGSFLVHVNMGHEGSEDGWYDFEGTIGGYDDDGYRKIATVHPVPEPSTFVLLGVGASLLLYRRRRFL
jgi:hypothetical protein